MKEYFVRQRVESVVRQWMVPVAICPNERLARLEFDRLTREHSDEYFELICSEETETCLEFTKQNAPA